MDRAVPFGRIVAHVTPHFVTRQIFTGAGKVGMRGCRASPATTCRYQLSQRADFFEEEVGLETTLKRPIVNTRDEPHCRRPEVPPAARDRRRRQPGRGRHLPQGRHHGDRAGDDRGRLRSATTALLGNPVPAHPPGQSYDPSLTRTDRAGATARRVTALEMQWELLDRARKYADDRTGSTCVGEDGRRRRAAPVGGGAHRARDRSRRRWPTRSTGWPSSASSTATRERHGLELGRRPAGGDRPAVPRPAARASRLAARVGLETPRRPTTRSTRP